jgi:hypothetical protein
MDLLTIVVLSACTRPGPDPTGAGGSPSADPSEQAVDPGDLAVASWALPLAGFARIDDPARPVVLGIERQGEALCPDCVDLPPEACPEACARDVVVAMDEQGQTADWLEVFPAGFDDSLTFVSAATLPDGSALVAWQRCDRSPCGLGLPRDTCSATVVRMASDGTPMGAPRRLHPGWLGLTRLVGHPERPEVLALAAPGDRRASARVAVLDASGAPLLDWTPLGGPLSQGHHAAPAPDGFVVALDDRAPSLPPTEPCPDACSCGPDWSGFEPDAGIDVYEVTAEGVGPRQPRARSESAVEVTAVTWGPEGPVLAGITSDHQVLVDGPDGVRSWAGGSPMWAGALAVDGGAAAVFHDLDGRLMVHGTLGGAPFTEILAERGIGIEPTTRAGEGSVEALVLRDESAWAWQALLWSP